MTLYATPTATALQPVQVPVVVGSPIRTNSADTQTVGVGQSDVQSPLATIRMLHVVNGELFSGAERVQSHLGRCLPQFGVSADFASVKPGLFTRRLSEQNGLWGRSFEMPMAHRGDLRAASKLIDVIEQQRYELIHAHTPRTAMLAAIASMKTAVPWIYHVHSPAARDSSRGWVNRINAWIEKRSLGNCHGIIAVSESLAHDCIAAGHDPAKISVVHNGVPAICPARQNSPVIGGPWVFGMVALMRPRKGLEIVLQSIADLVADGHDVRLRCIGSYETQAYRDSIDNLIEKLNSAAA